MAGTVTRFDYGSDRKNVQHYGSVSLRSTFNHNVYLFRRSRQPTTSLLSPLTCTYTGELLSSSYFENWILRSDDDFLADPQDFNELLLPMLNPDYVKVLFPVNLETEEILIISGQSASNWFFSSRLCVGNASSGCVIQTDYRDYQR